MKLQDLQLAQLASRTLHFTSSITTANRKQKSQLHQYKNNECKQLLLPLSDGRGSKSLAVSVQEDRVLKRT